MYFYRKNVVIPTYINVFYDSADNNFALGWNANLGFQFDIGLGPWIDISAEYQTIYNVPGPIDPEQPDRAVPDLTVRRSALERSLGSWLYRIRGSKRPKCVEPVNLGGQIAGAGVRR